MTLWAQKLYTPSGITRENILKGKKALDVGCGQRKLEGATGVDIVHDSQADVVHDIDKTPWPFEDDSFDLVFMHHVLEHAQDVLKTLAEIHRIGKHGARIVIQVPYFRAVDAFSDPTHKHFFTASSLDYALQDTGLAGYNYTPFRFKKIGFWYGWPHSSRNPIVQLMKRFMHSSPKFYDQYLSLLLPTRCLTWELEVVK